MFTCGLRETTEKSVVLRDVTPDAFKILLKYVYTRQLKLKEIPEDVLLELLVLAHKYELPALEDSIATYVTSTLSPETFVKVMEVASLYASAGLQEACQEFLRRNAKSILESESLLKAREVRLTQLFS